jgi:hypothetical protein
MRESFSLSPGAEIHPQKIVLDTIGSAWQVFGRWFAGTN